MYNHDYGSIQMYPGYGMNCKLAAFGKLWATFIGTNSTNRRLDRMIRHWDTCDDEKFKS